MEPVKEYVATLTFKEDPAEAKKMQKKQQQIYNKQIKAEGNQRLRSIPMQAKREEELKIQSTRKVRDKETRRIRNQELKAERLKTQKATQEATTKPAQAGASGFPLGKLLKVGGALAVASKLLKPLTGRLFGNAGESISDFQKRAQKELSARVVGRQTGQSREQIRQLRANFQASGLSSQDADAVSKALFETTRTKDTQGRIKEIVSNLKGASPEAIRQTASIYGINEDTLATLVAQAEAGQSLGQGVAKVSSKGQKTLQTQAKRSRVAGVNIETKNEQDLIAKSKDLASAEINQAQTQALEKLTASSRALDQSIKDLGLAELGSITEDVYDVLKDEVAVGIKEVNENLKKIVDPKSAKRTSEELDLVAPGFSTNKIFNGKIFENKFDITSKNSF